MPEEYSRTDGTIRPYSPSKPLPPSGFLELSIDEMVCRFALLKPGLDRALADLKSQRYVSQRAMELEITI